MQSVSTAIGSRLAVGEGASGYAAVDGVVLKFYAFRLDDGTVNVGRITVEP